MGITYVAGRWNLWNHYTPDEDVGDLSQLLLTEIISAGDSISLFFDLEGSAFEATSEAPT